MDILLIQLFWVSLLVVGAAVLLFWHQRYPWLSWRLVAVEHLPLPALVYLCFIAGAASFALPVMVAYLLQLPTVWVGALYGLSVAAAVLYLWRYRRRLLTFTGTRFPKGRRQWLVAAMVVLALGLDYILSLWITGPLQWDAGVHIARILFVASGHFSMRDPNLGYHGVVDPRYSTNLILGFMGMGARLLHVSAVVMWQYSYGFLRCMLWLAFFYLTWCFFNKDYRTKLAYFLLIAAPFLLSSFFFNIEFPDRTVFIWIPVFLVGIEQWIASKSLTLLLAGALLIAETHTLYAVMALLFLGLCTCLFWVLHTLPSGRSWQGILVGSVLALPLYLQVFYPPQTSLMTAGARNAGTISGSNFQLTHYGSLAIDKLPHVDLSGAILMGLIVVFIALITYKSNKFLRRISASLGIIVIAITYYPAAVSLVGYYLGWRRVSHPSYKVILLVLVSFYALIAFNPVVAPTVSSHEPSWAIARFQEFNVFGLFIWVLPWLVVCEYPLRAWKDKMFTRILLVLVLPLYVAISHFTTPLAPLELVSSSQAIPRAAYNRDKVLVADIARLRPSLIGQTVYSIDPSFSFYLPAVLPHTYTLTTLDSNYSSTADIKQRDACALRISQSASLADLRAASVTRIVNTYFDAPSYNREAHLLDSKSYLKKVQQVGKTVVYAVQPTAHMSLPSSRVCTIPWGE